MKCKGYWIQITIYMYIVYKMFDTGKVERFTPEHIEDIHFVMMYSQYLRIYRLENYPQLSRPVTIDR